MEKLILTIDLDAFFASCEELRNPIYKGKPMVVGKELNGRGIASTANYAARKYGIKSGMPLFKIRKILPNIIVIPPDHKYYQDQANKVFEIVKSFSDLTEFASIDECYVDVTNLTNKLKPIEIAKLISNKIYQKTNLTVSIGLSNNIILSKIASGINKPKGITTLFSSEIKNKLWKLDVKKLYMIGESTRNKLNENGIFTIGDLANLKNDFEKYSKLKKLIGINIDKHINVSNGISRNERYKKEHVNKSISKEKTFGISISNINLLRKELKLLFNFALERMKRRKLVANNLTIFLKIDKNFNKKTITKKIDQKTDSNEKLWIVATNLLDDIFKQGMSVKQIGIGFSGLKKKEKI